MTRRTTSPFDFVDPQDSEVQSVSDERLEMETSSGRNQSEITQSPRVVGSCVRVLRSRTIRFHHSSINNPPNIGTPNSRSATGSGSDMELRNESTSMSANPQASMDVDMSVQMMSELSLKDQQTSKEDKQINEDSVQLASVDMSIANETKEELMEIKSKVICETEELQNTKEPYQLDGSAVPMTSLMEITVDRSALISVDNRQHQSSCVKSEKSKLYTPQFKMVSSSLMGGSYLSSPIQVHFVYF